MTNLNWLEIKKTIETYEKVCREDESKKYESRCYGIRTQDNKELDSCSYHWDFENDCTDLENPMDGVCTTEILVDFDEVDEDSLELAKLNHNYAGEYTFLVVGENDGYGDMDECEAVLSNCTVLATYER